MRAIPLLMAAALVLGGCDLLQAPAEKDKAASTAETAASEPPTGGVFAHSQTEDLSGFYYPANEVGTGDARLLLVFVGQAQDFAEWEEGKRTAGLAPILMEFAGGERVLPDRYFVSDDRIRMSGENAKLGRVSVDLRLDAGALATARRNLGPDEDAALEGTVSAGGQSHSGAKFAWSMGG